LKGEKKMKKGKYFAVVVLILLVLAAITPFSVAAKANAGTICSLETDYDQVPGRTWTTNNDTQLHVRGQTTLARIEPLPGHPECDPRYASGDLVTKVNLDLNLVSGEGRAWGSSTLTLRGINGTFVGPFVAKITPAGMQGMSITVGTGALKGLLEKVTIQQIGETTYEIHGTVYGR
jgi:hypothetical protein